MNATHVMTQLKRPIAFRPQLAHMTGGVNPGLVLSQALYWQKVAEDDPGSDGWFYKTTAEWRKETGLTRAVFESARRKLIVLELIDYQIRGIPAQGYYRVNLKKLVASLQIAGFLIVATEDNQLAKSPRSSLCKSSNLLVDKERYREFKKYRSWDCGEEAREALLKEAQKHGIGTRGYNFDQLRALVQAARLKNEAR